MVQISIIIINFNTPVVTLNCLTSITENLQNIYYEIILVDNAPKENHKLSFCASNPYLNYYRSDFNLGFGGANNLGMSKAIGKYYLLLNSDTLFINQDFPKCIEYLDNNSKIGMLGCKLLNEDGSYQGSFYPFTHDTIFKYFICNNPLLFKLFNVKNKYKEPHTIKQVGDISGAFMLLRSELYTETKGFDPDFFLYCEETEWCRNRIEPRYKIVYFPEVEIIHIGGKSAPKPLMLVQSNISLALYWYKKNVFLLPLFIFLNFLNALFFALQYPICSKESKATIKIWFSIFAASLPYWFTQIPRYSNKFAARKEPLIYEKARSVFFLNKGS